MSIPLGKRAKARAKREAFVKESWYMCFNKAYSLLHLNTTMEFINTMELFCYEQIMGHRRRGRADLAALFTIGMNEFFGTLINKMNEKSLHSIEAILLEMRGTR